ncbi:DUF2155 domain-containing protein [Tabrizicola sp.]|uniref:DUF2155 domain-containing protein n=1 Tax=Tabrizicola sp. TaxID=2005166 RepID=UPI00286BB16A|nr:DUF2155 domain-containing protein [Tabrizicola sp.]
MKAALFALVLAGPVAAQDFTDSEGGTLRWLDKLTSETGDVELSRGQAAQVGRLVVQLDSCHYPTDNPVADAEAHLTIVDQSVGKTIFSGWMLASSPALSALDHPRYDVWVLRCVIPEGAAVPDTSDAEGE